MPARKQEPTEPELDLGPPPAPEAELPEGFRYVPDVLSAGEEKALVARFAELPFAPFDFQGYQAKRRVVYFGQRYDYSVAKALPAPELPDYLQALRARVVPAVGRDPERFAQALVTEYTEGTPIGWHRDRPHYDEVIGVSLLSPCPFRFRRVRPGGGWERVTLTAEPRSVYLLSGPARSEWEHSIPPVERLRYSVTFRSLR